jgi:hypothetical protein
MLFFPLEVRKLLALNYLEVIDKDTQNQYITLLIDAIY